MATATPIKGESDTLTLYDLVERTGLSYTTIYEPVSYTHLTLPTILRV